MPLRRLQDPVYYFISRSSFYRNFEDIFELYNSVCEDIITDVLLDIQEDFVQRDMRLFVEAISEKVLHHSEKIRLVAGKNGNKLFVFRLRNSVYETLRRHIMSAGKRDDTHWLKDAGIINVCYCMQFPELPLKGNYNPDNFKLYFGDVGLLIASLDDEVQEDLRVNKNLGTYKGAIYESIVGDMLVKQGYSLYFYKNEKGTLEMDFFIRDAQSLIPVEVKAIDGSTVSLNNLIDKEKYSDIKYGIKLGYKNIGYNEKFYTFPYFLTFLLKRFVSENNK